MRYSLLVLALLSWNVYAAQAQQKAAPQDTDIVEEKQDTEPVKVVTTPNETVINVSYPEKKNTPAAANAQAQKQQANPEMGEVLSEDQTLVIDVVGQGVAPMRTASPAQAYALAKRAAIADAYRLIAEKVKGVRIDGQDLIRNMMVKRSTVRTSVQAMVRNANIVETTFKDGLCEVEMEIVLSYDQFAR